MIYVTCQNLGHLEVGPACLHQGCCSTQRKYDVHSQVVPSLYQEQPVPDPIMLMILNWLASISLV